jgi:predicted dehydrogenase
VGVNWGFVGAGWIAQKAMAPAVHASSAARLVSVASRDPDRARGLGSETVYTDYRALLDDAEVDVVYVCLANHQHAELAIEALRAGKHVLCEKPLALDATQAALMMAEARGVDRLLVEAVWTRWHPRFRRMVELASDGTLGDVNAIESSFTFPGAIDGNYRSDPAMGGGALLDVGGYQAHAWVALTAGAADMRLTDVNRRMGATGVDLTTGAVAVLDDRVSVSMLCSFDLPEQQTLTVIGSAVRAEMVRGAAFTSWREESALAVGGRFETFAPVNAYVAMIDAVSKRTLGEDAWVVPLEDSLRVAQIVDEIARFEAAPSNAPVD